MNAVPSTLSDAEALLRGNIELELASSDTFDVRDFRLQDSLSTLFRADITVVCDNPGVEFEDLIGKAATFRVKLDGGLYPNQSERVWTGVVAELQQIVSEDSGLSTYHVAVVPKMWLLTQRTNCRIFQQKTELEIVQELLKEWDITPVVECSREQKTRKCRVQYHESDHAFIARLLEASGVTYFFRQKDGETALVLNDAPERAEQRAQPLPHMNTPYPKQIHATRFRAVREVRHGVMTFADHDYRLKNEPLMKSAKSGENQSEARLEKFTYHPGNFKFGTNGLKETPTADDRGRTRSEPNEAQRIAQQAASAAHAKSKRFSFATNALDVGAGSRLGISGHTIAEKTPMLVTHITWVGTHDSQIQASVDCVSAEHAYAPEAVTPEPRILGIESATVVGPAGETIHCDEFGRVRVQFHWDRYGAMDEQASVWLHVNQPWAGDGFGMLHLPRIGQEVIVSFVGGNPEEPVVVGRTFTNLLRPPYELPANKTQSGFKSATVPAKEGAFNELMFEDKDGHELIRIQAERDMRSLVKNDQTLNVRNNRSDTINGNDTEKVDGNQKHTVLKSLMSKVGGDAVKKVAGELGSFVGKSRLFKTVQDFVSAATNHRVDSTAMTELTVGKSLIQMLPDKIIIQSPLILLNPGATPGQSLTLKGLDR
ncbi:MAG: type VI secretion system tip protein VgrG [Polyangiaceae bacterium]|nr:type VI secretion system tip protein VgrG [Polyangiaceae bacterium]